MRKINSWCLVACAFLFFGCDTLKVLTFQKAELSGIKGKQKIRLFYLQNDGGDSTFKIKENGTPFQRLNYQLSTCKSVGIAPAFIPLIAAGGTLIVGQITDALASMAEKLRKQGAKEYSAKVLVETPVLIEDAPECLFFVRYGKESKEDVQIDNGSGRLINKAVIGIDNIGLAAVFQKVDFGNGYSWKLIYLWQGNALAITEKNDSPKINVSFAVTGKATEKHYGKFKINDLGKGTITISGVPIGASEPIIDCGAGPMGGLGDCDYYTEIFVSPISTRIRTLEWVDEVLKVDGEAYQIVEKGVVDDLSGWRIKDVETGNFQKSYPQLETLVFASSEEAKNVAESLVDLRQEIQKGAMFSIGVTEIGSVANSFSQTKAELKALNAALGPAVGETLKALLAPKEE